MRPKVIRYAVRPKNTIRGWYVWAVILDDGKEKWATLPRQTCGTKLEARAICDSLNKKKEQEYEVFSFGGGVETKLKGDQ